MNNRTDQAIAAILSESGGGYLALAPSALPGIVARVAQKLAGPRSEAYSPPREAQRNGATVVIPIRGVIVQHAGYLGDVTTDWIARAIDELMRQPSVGRIILDIDSPGGVVFGVEELAAKIRDLRGRKPIIAIANSMAASAAYWIGSAATSFYATHGGQVGSVGVWNMHVDISKLEEKLGLKTTLVFAGRFKIEGHPWAPLEDEARAEMQRHVDAYYDRFVQGVARGRGVTPAKVRSKFGEGRLVLAREAAALGMVDGVATMEEIIADPTTGRGDRAARVERLLRESQAWNTTPPNLRRANALLALAQAEGGAK